MINSEDAAGDEVEVDSENKYDWSLNSKSISILI